MSDVGAVLLDTLLPGAEAINMSRRGANVAGEVVEVAARVEMRTARRITAEAGDGALNVVERAPARSVAQAVPARRAAMTQAQIAGDGARFGAGRSGVRGMTEPFDDIRPTRGPPRAVQEVPPPPDFPLTNREARQLHGPHRGLIRVTENTSKSSAARAFESGAPGAYTDLATRQSVVPALRFENPNSRGVNFVRFDGIDDAGRLIDRKLNVTTHRKQIMDLQRMDNALRQNARLGVIEVPTPSAYRAAERALVRAGAQNLTVELVR